MASAATRHTAFVVTQRHGQVLFEGTTAIDMVWEPFEAHNVVLRDADPWRDAHSMSFSDMSAEAEAELAAWRGILNPS